MSAIIVPNVGEKEILLQLRGHWNAEQPLILAHLYVNDLTPDEDTVLADFTEPALTGYGTLSLSAWSGPALTPDAEAYVSQEEVTFTASAGTPVLVYGYFVSSEDGDLMWAQRFHSPRTYGPANPVTFGIIFKLRQIPVI